MLLLITMSRISFLVIATVYKGLECKKEAVYLNLGAHVKETYALKMNLEHFTAPAAVAQWLWHCAAELEVAGSITAVAAAF